MVHGRVDADRSRGRDRRGCCRTQPITDRLWVSAGVLLWRLNVELRQGAEFPESVERRAFVRSCRLCGGERRLWSMEA